jgi:hypothetical protein
VHSNQAAVSAVRAACAVCAAVTNASTATLFPSQVVQQQQQVQMSFAWSFLHVGQSMTANVFHASAAAGGGPRAARRLARRIVGWAAASCMLLALATYHNRCTGCWLAAAPQLCLWYVAEVCFDAALAKQWPQMRLACVVTRDNLCVRSAC